MPTKSPQESSTTEPERNDKEQKAKRDANNLQQLFCYASSSLDDCNRPRHAKKSIVVTYDKKNHVLCPDYATDALNRGSPMNAQCGDLHPLKIFAPLVRVASSA